MELAIGVAAAVAAMVSAVFVWFQTREMGRQTALQREVAESSAQPYVWADVRLQSSNGWNLEFVVGNAGPTVATDVRVLVEPTFPRLREGKFIDAMHENLQTGIASIAPGREICWTIGASPDLVGLGQRRAHKVRITATGPFGPVAVSEYVIDMGDLAASVAKRPGTLRDVAKALEALTKRLPDGRRPITVELTKDE